MPRKPGPGPRPQIPAPWLGGRLGGQNDCNVTLPVLFHQYCSFPVLVLLGITNPRSYNSTPPKAPQDPQNRPGPRSGIVRARMGPYGTGAGAIWDHMGPNGTTWDRGPGTGVNNGGSFFWSLMVFAWGPYGFFDP